MCWGVVKSVRLPAIAEDVMNLTESCMARRIVHSQRSQSCIHPYMHVYQHDACAHMRKHTICTSVHAFIQASRHPDIQLSRHPDVQTCRLHLPCPHHAPRPPDIQLTHKVQDDVGYSGQRIAQHHPETNESQSIAKCCRTAWIACSWYVYEFTTFNYDYS